MNRFYLLGLVLCGGAGVMVLFEFISASMSPGEIVLQFSSLVDLFGEAPFEWIYGISVGFLQNGLDYLVTVPAWNLLAALGILCFILGGITSR